MRRFASGVLWAIGGYFAGALLGYLLVLMLSGNRHDLEVEAAMTAAFFAGPLGALVAGIVGFVRGGRASGAGDARR
jgi:NhaP-type Na+/H+ or K+/H+ antiporter